MASESVIQNPDLVDLCHGDLDPQHPIYICRACQTDLALDSDLVSPSSGPWILEEVNGDVGLVFSRVVNVDVHRGQQKVRVVGFRTETITCSNCNHYLGWNYLQVPEGSRLTPGMTYVPRGVVNQWDGTLVLFDESPESPPFYMCAICGTGLAYDADISGADENFIDFNRAFNLRRTSSVILSASSGLFIEHVVCNHCSGVLGFESIETENGAVITRVNYLFNRSYIMRWPEDS